MPLRATLIAVVICVMSAGCSEPQPAPEAQPESAPSFPPAMSPYEPDIDPADFVAVIDNPYMPLEPGTTHSFKGASEGEKEKNTIIVTSKTKEVMGVTCTVVKDVVTVEGEIAELTFDWFAQDRNGNVWYFGELSKEYEDGQFAGIEGSWEAGVDGALPGIVMLADPDVGERYWQEYYQDEAEDQGEVLKLDASVEVPYGAYDDALVTKDWNPLEPKVFEHKYYVKGIGLVLERVVKGPKEENELVDVTRS